MEINRFDASSTSEYQLDRIARARRYLERAATNIVQPERLDYVVDMGHYFLSLAAVAEETGRPVDKPNIKEISRSALELTDITLSERASRVQADVAVRIEDIKRLTFGCLEPAARLVDATNPESYLNILDMLAAGDVRFTRPTPA